MLGLGMLLVGREAEEQGGGLMSLLGWIRLFGWRMRSLDLLRFQVFWGLIRSFILGVSIYSRKYVWFELFDGDFALRSQEAPT